MRIAVIANSRTAIMARYGYETSFNTAFKAGMVMGLGLVSLGCAVLFILVNAVAVYYDNWNVDPEQCHSMMEAISGFGLGGSSIALFGRVGGGIYTKAADVGADLSGKVCNDFPEDDPRNPAVVADNVGDNVKFSLYLYILGALVTFLSQRSCSESCSENFPDFRR
jgi:inorganic pyrophosphatase